MDGLLILKVAFAILISLTLSQNLGVLGVEVIQDNSGCDKVLLKTPKHALTSTKVGVGYQVCAEVGGVIYYCPGDRICCTPGDPNSKCCPADHPLCLPEGCCPRGYPQICGRYCCKEESFCCDGGYCCTDEASCCGDDKCCTQEAPCCKYGESKECCDKNLQACCDGYGCVQPCESQFDIIECKMADLSLSSKSVESAGVWRELGETLYRVINPNDCNVGLTAKNPTATKTVISHVNCGSRPKYTSQFISTTTSLEVTKKYMSKAEGKGRVAEIKVDDIPSHCKSQIIDLTIKANRDKYLGNAVCKNYAKADYEVLLVCDKPIPCRVIDPPQQREEL